MDSMQKIQVCVKTDIGLKREKNEDCYLIIEYGQDSREYEDMGTTLSVMALLLRTGL